MPFNIEQLDASASEDNVTILLGRNILLKITEDLTAKSLLAQPLVKKFVSVKNLCVQKTVSEIDEIVRADPSSSLSNQSDWLDFLLNQEGSESRKVLRGAERDPKRWRQGVNKAAVKWLTKADTELLSREEGLRQILGIDLLEPAVVMCCDKCTGLLGVNDFKGKMKCGECGVDVERRNAKRIHTHRVAESLAQVWRYGLWLEAYFAGLLRKLDWKTWVSVNIMGASGVSHEIDVLAIKEGNVIVAECKTGKNVSRNDVFNFLTKAQDTKIHLGLLVLQKSLPEPETRGFVGKNRLLSLLENIGGMKEDQILTKLKGSLPI